MNRVPDYFVGTGVDIDSADGDVSSPAGPGSFTESGGDHDVDDYDSENGSGDHTTLGSSSGDYSYDEGDDDDDESQEDASDISLNGTTFVIIINDNDHINSVSLASPDKFLSFIRPNVSASDTSTGDIIGDQWNDTSGMNKLCTSAI